MADLPDVNVWIAFTEPDHIHHARAIHFWEQEAEPQIAFCRVTAMGYLRLATNPSATRTPVSAAEAWTAYRQLRKQPGVRFIDEPPDVEQVLEEWAMAGSFSHRHWTDAHLAAIAVAGDLRLVSFDRDFRRFDGLDLLLLRP